LLGTELYGVLNVASASLSRFDDGQRNLLRQVASLVSASLQARRLLRQVQERARQEQALREITANVRSTMDTETILRTAVRDLGDLLGRKAFIRMGEPAANPDNGKENGQ
jgi:GAF domain-containing protein